METLFIEMYDTYNNEHKFNYTKGGDGVVGFTMSEEHKNILKKCNAGNNYATGSKHTDEWKRKASYYRRGKFNPNYNKKFDLNHRLKLSKNKLIEYLNSKINGVKKELDFIDSWIKRV